MPDAYTPGPWGLFDGRSSSLDGQQLVLADAPTDWLALDLATGKRQPDFGFANRTIAIVCEDTERFGEWTPNARLIAAAPDLLSALYECAASLAMYQAAAEGLDALAKNPALQAARAAIQKATRQE